MIVSNPDEDVEQLELLYIPGGDTNDIATLEISLAISYKHTLTYHPVISLLGTHCKLSENMSVSKVVYEYL